VPCYMRNPTFALLRASVTGAVEHADVLRNGHALASFCQICREADRQRAPVQATIATQARSHSGGL
jgi:hypothetical protein